LSLSEVALIIPFPCRSERVQSLLLPVDLASPAVSNVQTTTAEFTF